MPKQRTVMMILELEASEKTDDLVQMAREAYGNALKQARVAVVDATKPTPKPKRK